MTRQYSKSAKRAKRHRFQRSGLTVVELAITLPVLFLILFASYELCRANLLRHVARAAAYEGARIGILPGADANEVKTSVRRVLATVGVHGANITVTPPNIQARTPTVQVDVEIDARTNFLFAPFFFRNATFAGDCTLTREVL
jgi:Flp pilus assembly protein TadG